MAGLDFVVIERIFSSSSKIITNYTWTTLVAGILMCFGKERELEKLVAYILDRIETEEGEPLVAMRTLREGTLKAGALSGFPRAINSLTIIHAYLLRCDPELGAILASDKSFRDDTEPNHERQRGLNFFSKVYGQHTERVIKSLDESSGGEMAEFAIYHIYARILSETKIFGEQETGLLEFACCLALCTEPQAKGHMFGARNLGASGADVRSVIALVKHLAKQLEVSWSDKSMPWLEKAQTWE